MEMKIKWNIAAIVSLGIAIFTLGASVVITDATLKVGILGISYTAVFAFISFLLNGEQSKKLEELGRKKVDLTRNSRRQKKR